MNIVEKFYQEFSKELAEIRNQLSEKAVVNERNNFEWEKIKCKIESGLADTFLSIMVLSYNIANQKDKPAPKYKFLTQIKDFANLSPEARFYHIMKNFCSKLKNDWEKALAKNEEFNYIEEAEKEKIKLAFLEKIERLFDEKYSSIMKMEAK